MKLTVNEQNNRYGTPMLVIRNSETRGIVMWFPKTMRDMVDDMLLEAKFLENDDLPALVQKYLAKRAEWQAANPEAVDKSSEQIINEDDAQPTDEKSRNSIKQSYTTPANTDFADLSSHPHAVKPIPAMISAKEPELLPKPRPTANGVTESVAAAAKSMESLGVALTANTDDVKLSQLLQAALKLSRKAQNDQLTAEASRREAVSSWQKYRKALESAGVDPTILAEAEAHS